MLLQNNIRVFYVFTGQKCFVYRDIDWTCSVDREEMDKWADNNGKFKNHTLSEKDK